MDIGLLFSYLLMMFLPVLAGLLIYYWRTSIRRKQNEADASRSVEEIWQEIGLVGEDPANYTIITVLDTRSMSGRCLVRQDGKEAGFFLATGLSSATFDCNFFSGGMWVKGKVLRFRDGSEASVTGIYQIMTVTITSDGHVYSFPRGVNEKDVLADGEMIGRCLLKRTRTLKLLAIRRDIADKMLATICWLI